MKPLESITHLIFELLIDEIPLTMIRVSKHFYDTITPGLYEVVELNKDNIHKVFWGLLIELREKKENDPPEPQPEGRGGKKNKKEKKKWKIGERKLNLLRLIKYITFNDSQSVDKFFKKVKTFDQVNHERGIKEYQRILASVKHFRFGRELVASLSTDFTKIRRSFLERMTYYGLIDYIEEIMFHCQPLSICLEWPGAWERDERYFNEEDDDDIFEPTLGYAINDLLQEIVKHNGNDNLKFRIHMHSFYFHETNSVLEDFPLEYEMIFDLEDTKEETFVSALLGEIHMNYLFNDFEKKPKVSYLMLEMEGLKEEMDKEFGMIGDKDFVGRIHTTLEKDVFCPCCKLG